MKRWLFCLLISCSLSVAGQSDKEAAENKKNRAIELMDNGNPDEAIRLLDEAKKLNPDNYAYEYERGYAFYIKKDYKTALKIFEGVIKYKDINDRCYQMLGNLYDLTGKPEKALAAYDKGLKKFPNSGRLYLEKGNVFWNKKKYDQALPFYETGIRADPMFPSNYYRATLIFCSSAELAWGMIYGEIFMNLERNSRRTSEVSKLLFDTYRNNIEFKSDTVKTGFSKKITVSLDDLKDPGKLKLPYGALVYEPTLLMSITGEKQIDINSLDRIRTNFVKNYIALGFDKKYPNALFEFQNKVLEAGFMEPYNQWVLMMGDKDIFESWKNQNRQSWTRFTNWLKQNGLKLDETNKVFRNQY